jgi:hypothetical protein
LTDHYPDSRALIQTVSLHVLEGLSPALLHNDAPALPALAPDPVEPTDTLPTPAADESSFEWKPPDLSYGSPWYKARVADLVAAACTFPGPAPLIEEGLESLRTHRSNYDDAGLSPTKLQLLWWMFPKEHWVKLHEGCSMNFLVKPRCETTPNSEMDEEQIVIGEDFLYELLSLGVLIKVAPGEMVANGPLFCLPKPGQPGQWHILSDMRRGGQNEAIGANPTVFPKSGSILEQLYTGGYSVVIDATNGSIWVVSTPLGMIFSMCTQGSLWVPAILPVLLAAMAPPSSACCVPSAIFSKADRTTKRGGAPTNGALRLIRISGKGGF